MSDRAALVNLFKEQLENESQSIASARGLIVRGDFLIWWYFLNLQGLPEGTVDDIVCDGGNDLGIDAIHIDDDDIVHFYHFKNPERLDVGLPATGVDSLLAGLRLIIARKHGQVANPELRERLEDVYQIVPAGYRVHLVTSGTGMAEESRQKLNAFIAELRPPADDFFAWQLEDIAFLQDSFYQKRLPTIEAPIVFNLDRQPPYQVRSSNHDSYMFHAQASVLANLFDTHGEKLLQQNIRVFQGDRATNAVIRTTCTGPEAGNFFHFNNGVTFLCETAQWDQFVSTLTLNKAQLVNGGQTVRVISRAHSSGTLKPEVIVPVRVITSQGDKSFASNVAVNLNNQTRIETSFLRSNDPHVIQLAAALESRGWYLERREDEVATLTTGERTAIESRIGAPLADRLIRLKEGTQAYTATFSRQPELAKKNPKRMFLGSQDGGIFERLFEDISAEKIVLAHRLKRAVDRFVERFMALKRRKVKLANWRNDYASLLSEDLVTKHGDTLDQVVPQSAVFISALIFEKYVQIQKGDPEAVIGVLETGNTSPIRNALEEILDFAAANPTVANKSWPTLLKSQAFFDTVAAFVQGIVAGVQSARPAATETAGTVDKSH